MKLLIAGEGPTEIGDRAAHPAYRERERRRAGLIEIFISREKAAGTWSIADGVLWKSVRKYRSGRHRGAEARTVLGLALQTEEAGCDALVFVRDRDRDEKRAIEINEGKAEAQQLFASLRIVGGVAVEAIEAWVLAVMGEPESERLRDPKAQLEPRTSVGAMEEIVTNADLTAIPDDAVSLVQWLDDLRALDV